METILLGAQAAAIALAVGALPLGVLALWFLLRDTETDADRHERALATRLAELELYGGERCLECRTPVEPEWLACPVCATELRERCDDCGGMLKLHWNACPYCASEVGVREPELTRAA